MISAVFATTLEETHGLSRTAWWWLGAFFSRCPPDNSVPSWLVGVSIPSRRAPEIDILIAVRRLPQHSAPLGHSAPFKLIGALLAAWPSTGHSMCSMNPPVFCSDRESSCYFILCSYFADEGARQPAITRWRLGRYICVPLLTYRQLLHSLRVLFCHAIASVLLFASKWSCMAGISLFLCCGHWPVCKVFFIRPRAWLCRLMWPYSIQLSLRKFWFGSTHDSQWLYKNWFKSVHDSKWIFEIWFKSAHNSKQISEIRFKLTHDSKNFQNILIQINPQLIKLSRILIQIDSWLKKLSGILIRNKPWLNDSNRLLISLT